MKNFFFIAFVAIALFTTSCSKDTGGNADMSTVDFTVLDTQWNEFGTFGNPGYGFYVDLSMPEITNNVILNGMVSLYVKTGESWTPVPVYYYNDGYQGGYFYSMKNGLFSIDYYESDHKTERPTSQIFRLVIVQPN